MAKLSNSQRAAYISAATVGLIVGGASLGWSVWSDNNIGDGISSSTGALNLYLDIADGTWTRTTPGYATQLCGPFDPAATPTIPNCATDPQSVVTMPGDTFEYVVPITITAQGQNLAARFDLAFTADGGSTEVADAIAAGKLQVTYYLSNPGSAPYTQAYPATGVPATWGADNIGVYVMNMSGGNSTWNLVVDIAVLGDYVWVSDFTNDSPSLNYSTAGGAWNTAAISANLVQVRGGSDG